MRIFNLQFSVFKKYLNNKKGIALYIAVTITAALILVSFAIVNLVLKQIGISSLARDSQAAFYSADSGIECALFWDLKNPTVAGRSAFATTTFSNMQQISCNGITITPTPGSLVNGAGTSTFTFTLNPDQYCSVVSVGKSYSSGAVKTRVESRGYNSCSSSNQRRIERGVLVTY